MTSDQLPEVGAIEEEIAVEAQDELAIVEEVPQPAQVSLQFLHVQQAAVDFFGQELIQVAQPNLAMEGAQNEDSGNEDSDDESEDEEVQEDVAPFQENLLIIHPQGEDNAEDHQAQEIPLVLPAKPMETAVDPPAMTATVTNQPHMQPGEPSSEEPSSAEV